MKFFHYFVWAFMVLMFLGCNSSSKNESVSLNNTPSTTENNRQETLRIACVGDSLTEGFGYPKAKEESYPIQLSTLVGETMEVKNFGFSNKTAMSNEKDFSTKTLDPYINTSKYNDSKAYNPNTVIIMFGTNDIKDQNWNKKDNFIKDYTALIKSYKDLSSNPKIYICLPPPSFGDPFPGSGITENRISNELIPKIKEVASNMDLPLIDLHTPFLNKAEFFHDGLHPSKEGAIKIAEIIYENIY